MSALEALARYRQRMLQTTEWVALPGTFLLPDQAQSFHPVRIPLRRIYSHLQPLCHVAGHDPASGHPETVPPTRQTSRPNLVEIAAVLSQYGEEFYRCGQVYRTVERPDALESDTLLPTFPRVVLLGAAGSGKTTLLQYLLRKTLLAAEGPIPFLLRVKDYMRYRRAGGRASLAEYAMQTAADGDAALYETFVYAEARLWLVDGLEDADVEQAELINAIQALPGQWVVTSRVVNYHPNGLETVAHLEMLPMSAEEVDRFLWDWLLSLSKHFGAGNEWVEQRFQWMKTELTRRPKLQHLAGNPFFLTCLGMISWKDHLHVFPEQRVDVYRLWLEQLAVSIGENVVEGRSAGFRPARSASKDAGDPNQAFQPQALAALSEIGWQFQQQHDHAIEMLLSHLAPQGEQAEELLAFWQQAGLLEATTIQERVVLDFRHVIVQEYAAAQNMAQRWNADADDGWNQLQPLLHHPAWREPLLLLTGTLERPAVEMLLNRILRWKSDYERVLHRGYRLAAVMLGERDDMQNSALTGRIVAQLTRLRNQPDPPRALLFALIYAVGVLSIFGLSWATSFSFAWFWLLTIVMLWTLIWGALIMNHEFPGVQRLITLPLRLWPILQPHEDILRVLGLSGQPEVVPVLLQALSDLAEPVRRTAAEALGQLEAVEAVPLLLDALHDDAESVRKAAARALAQIGAIPRLVQALNESDARVRQAAGEALKCANRAQTISHLALMLHDSKEYVRKAAVETLRQMGSEQTIPLLIQALRDAHEDVRLIAVEALGALAKQSDFYAYLQVGPELLRTLRDPEPQVRWAAAQALGHIGDPALLPELFQALRENKTYVRRAITDALRRVAQIPSVLYLLQSLHDEDADVRKVTVETLGHIGTQEHSDVQAHIAVELQGMLSDSDKHVRCVTAEALGRIRSRDARPPLLALLDDPAWEVRWATVETLGKYGDPEVIPHLIPLLQDCHGYVIRMAVESLGRLQSSTAVPHLVQTLRSDKEYVQRTSEHALRQIGDAYTVPYLLQALQDGRDTLRQDAEMALRHIEDKQTIPYLLDALQTAAEEPVLKTVISALGRIDAVAAVPQLIALLSDTRENIRAIVAETLGELGDPQAIPGLLERLGDTSKVVRKNAVKALGKMKAAEAVQSLLEMLEDPDLNVRSSVVETLGKIEQFEAVPALLMALQDDAWSVRWTAAYALGRMRDIRVTRALIATLRDANGNVRRAAVEGLGQLGDPQAVQPLIEILTDQEWIVRWAAAAALGTLRDTRAVPALLRVLSDESANVRWAAVEALGKIGDAQTVPYLLPMLKDGNWDVRQAVANALRQLAAVAAIPDLLHAVRSGDEYVDQIASSALQHIQDHAALPYLIQGLQDEHEQVRAIAAYHLLRLNDVRAVPLLLPGLRHEHWKVRQMTADLLGQLAPTLRDQALLRCAARRLWWRLTDKPDVARAAFQALERIVNQLAALPAHTYKQ